MFNRGKLGIVQGQAERKLKRLGIDLDYRIEPSRAGSSSSDRGQPIYFDARDATMPDGASKGQLYLMLHELGHKFLTTRIPMKVRESATFTKLFGPFHKVYKRKPGPKPDRPNFISRYAQVHPQDDFAEAFAIYVMKDGDFSKISSFLKSKNKNSDVAAQIKWIDNFVKKL